VRTWQRTEARRGAAPRPAPERLPDPPAEEEVKVGERLRWARMRQGRTIAEVAKATGLSKGFISQIERDLTTPSVASLVRICAAVGIPVGALFVPSATNLIRADERHPIGMGGVGLREWLLTPPEARDLCVVETEIAPGGGSGVGTYTLDADAHWVRVLEGRVDMTVAGDTYLLEPGDALSFSPRDPHSFVNASEGTTRLLWVLANLRDQLGD
jgi:transcriptional regulator with XRE-family HTH domain